MSREIKFRAWDKQSSTMQPVQHLLYGAGRLRSVAYEHSLATHLPEHNIVLMQFTGLRDRNGADIYEGDIVQSTDFHYDGSDTPFIGLVKFHDSEWQMWHRDDMPSRKQSDGAYHLGVIRGNDDELEVLGNIYENPELLK